MKGSLLLPHTLSIMIRSVHTVFANAFSTQPASAALVANKDYFWCTCGKSLKQVIVYGFSYYMQFYLTPLQPFCDGRHKGSGLKSLKFSVPSDATKFLCVCKLTKSPPYCDGSHADIGGVSSSQHALSGGEHVRNSRCIMKGTMHHEVF